MTAETALPFTELGNLPALADAALEDVRHAGLERFRTRGIPDHRVEQWKYTRLSGLADSALRIATSNDADGTVDVPAALGDTKPAARLVFVNGQPRDDLSETADLPDGVRLVSLDRMARDDAEWLKGHLGNAIDDDVDGLVSLNTAALAQGCVLVVERGVTCAAPIEIVNVAAPGDQGLAWFPRNLVVLEENAEATVIVQQTGGGSGAGFVNAVTETTLGDNARLRVFTVDDSGAGATVVSRSFARLGRGADLQTFGLYHGRGLARYEQTVLLEGEGAEARLDGGYLLRGSAHCDNTTRIEHRVPNTTCNEVFKGVIDDTARAVFQGKIIVRPDAQHADGQMLNKSLLLSNKAEIDTKPELEIYADDVKCAHGATSGQIDEGALFYLRSRGIPEQTARNLLVRSFLGDVTERIGNDAIRAAIVERIERWLPDIGAETEEQAA